MRVAVLVLAVLLAGGGQPARAQGGSKGTEWDEAIRRVEAKQAAFNELVGCTFAGARDLAARSRETADVVAATVVADCMPYMRAYAACADIADMEGLRRAVLPDVVSLVVHFRADHE